MTLSLGDYSRRFVKPLWYWYLGGFLILAAVNLVWGLIGTYIGFFRPRYATPFVLACAGFYTVLAVLGTFTSHHLGMLLNDRVNLFHWAIVLPAWAIGLHALWRERR